MTAETSGSDPIFRAWKVRRFTANIGVGGLYERDGSN